MNVPPKKILLVLSETLISQTEKASGIYRYINKMRLNWEILLADSYRAFTPADARRERERGLDGVLVTMPRTTAAVRALLKAGVPVVQIEQPSVDDRRCLTVLNDERQIGVLAARELLKLTDRSAYCFVGVHGHAWSVQRERGFHGELSRHGRKPLVFGRRSDAALGQWIAKLPKPCAVFATDDRCACNIISVARSQGFRIPADVALLAVSPNNVFCDNCRPSLSRIQPDYERMGYEAAAALDRLVRQEPLPDRTVSIAPKGIVRCASLPNRHTGGAIAARALEYIRQNLQHPIAAEDIARNLGISRRLLFLRYRESTHETVLQTITRLRLEKLKVLLRESECPIADLCQNCGWQSANTPKALFQKAYGMTMRDFRQR